MHLQIAFVLLIGVIAALNANLYEYSETYDYYENYDESLTGIKGMQTLSFG